MKPRTRHSGTPPCRCHWAAANELFHVYHDEQWGVPLHDDLELFEMLILEGAQAGLSWQTILQKRPAYQKAFDRFVPEKVARYDRRKIEQLLRNPGIVRNRLKVESAVLNARAFLSVREEFGSVDGYLWQFVGGHPIQNNWSQQRQVPACTKESDALSQDLRKRGFKFVGTTIMYAFMQAVGMVNDHTTDCFRWAECRALGAAEAAKRAKASPRPAPHTGARNQVRSA